MDFDSLHHEADTLGIVVDQTILWKAIALDGLYICWEEHPLILINRHRSIEIQTVSLAEELGHHHKSSGIILAQDTVLQRKSETAGRAWSYEKALPASKLNGALQSGTCTFWELAELFNLPERFIQEAVTHYQRKSMLISAVQCHWCFTH